MLIVFEGIDGCGKTSFIDKYLLNFLSMNNVPPRKYVICRDPGGTKEGELIRSILPEFNNRYDQRVLHTLARDILYRDIISPALKKKQIVFCDRFYPSTAVYQYLQYGDVFCANNLPNIDLLFYLKVSPRVAYARKKEQTLEELTKLSICYDNYMAQAQQAYFIDADKNLDSMAKDIMAILEIDKIYFWKN